MSTYRIPITSNFYSYNIFLLPNLLYILICINNGSYVSFTFVNIKNFVSSLECLNKIYSIRQRTPCSTLMCFRMFNAFL